MTFQELLLGMEPLSVTGTLDLAVSGLYYDSRQVQPGGVFFALRGVKSDGTDFVPAALERGAVAVVTESPLSLPGKTVVQVANGRLAMSLMAAAFYGNASAAMPVVGITGTNGKTTTSYLVEGILEQAGFPCAVLGTVSYRLGDYSLPAPNTTPESVDLQRILRELADRGARAAVLEVSSHSLEQHRADGCLFDVGIFTNLTRDHLDYHLDMDSYFRSKLRLFTDLLTPEGAKPKRTAVVNLDDPVGAEIAAQATCPVLGYSVHREAELTVKEVDFSVEGISCTVVSPAGDIRITSDLLGRFNLYNILGAVGAGLALGLPTDAIRLGITSHSKVPGRLERVDNNHGITVLVDYAHTGDALENVLSTVSELKTGRIITVFGCGGDRDRGKRPIMAEVAARYSDLTVITSDNPRTEDPAAILADVRGGIPAGTKEYSAEEAGSFSEKGFTVIESRLEAIQLAIAAARRGDIVLLAGKGHEDYQIIGTTKHHFDDREEAAAALALRG
ncbi:UDP-N-acetylmuramoyl-L-alanyl-D-glutamate--2,6-diaminopimelate ligase [Geomonas sp. RF6]|uniref:UDP-N-acetylmuramoyl-L-alanyl-D-glutamate--2, 6-diaminopimelate ligase n=1 Tax=Geomonas sp. RF6 TaxID=2897342 RepID=UPI001E4596C8|nr:UDP-N-acetylmuramoyl-L-alanyl-D-glutamate--2,6-diaminopimelate ligase [Geomonas sp. RF6]UFS71637.1 UDP-N-acetylmuramoyl-L-alanyl-D-glutamate--2,6-diaminopimelate ligase [Geomonas sp. RF6]